VLFDLDGTLLNTYRLYMESFRRTLEPHFNRHLSDSEIMSLNPHAEQRLLLEVVQELEFNAYFERFLTYYATLHDALFDGLYGGVLDMLRTLRAQGYLLGVVTGKSREAWRITSTRLETEGFDELFDTVLTDDDVQNAKPDPEGLLIALDVFDLQPEQALYVGDSERDFLSAQAAGIQFGAALWPRAKDGSHTFAEPVGPEKAPLAFARPSDLLAMLSRPRKSLR
jgi:HAD superfamily hydrolase (TIGR01509 family)